MNKKLILVFLAIFLIASFLRLYELKNIPPGVNRDEASIGYTAYSILKTGSDEYGRSFPLSFQSFGDWKLPLYIYTVIPMVKLFGLNELAVRLPSALFGISSVIMTFFLIRILFKDNLLALGTMFLTAVSPWHLHLSRVESESNTAVFLTILAVTLFLKGIKKNEWLVVLSAVFFALTYFTYAGNHIFTTLLILGLTFIYRRELKVRKATLVASAVFLAMSGLIFSHTLFGADATKLSGISIFSDPSLVHAKIELPRSEHSNYSSFFVRLVHNRIIFALERLGQNYLSAYSPQFLFIKGGDNKAHNIQNFANMYLIEAPFLFLGLVYLIVLKKSREKKLALWWFFIAPIAASITKDAPHSNRMFAIFPILPLITALGFYWVLKSTFSKGWKRLFVLFIILLFLLNFAIYIDRYYVHFPRNEVENWGLGYKKLTEYISENFSSSKKIIISRPNYSPYIYILFYNKFDPLLYQKTAQRYPPTEDKFVHVRAFQRYEFREINWVEDLKLPDAVIAEWTDQVPGFVKFYPSRHEIILPDGRSMFTVIKTK